MNSAESRKENSYGWRPCQISNERHALTMVSLILIVASMLSPHLGGAPDSLGSDMKTTFRKSCSCNMPSTWEI